MLVVLALLLFSLNLCAQESVIDAAVVKSLQGDVKFNGNRLSTGQGISASGGTLTTGQNSSVKIGIHRWGSEISLGPNSNAEIVFSGPPNAQYLFLKEGLAEWNTTKTKRVPAGGEMVRTPTATARVSGGSFSLQYSNSGESEIAVFDGGVVFSSKLENSRALVSKNQQSRVGGKFGQKVSNPAPLSPDAAKMQVY